MVDFGQGVGLINDLRKLRASKKLIDGGNDGPGVDQSGGSNQVFGGNQAHLLTNGPLQAQEAIAESGLGD